MTAPTVGYICVSKWPDCCGSIHMAPWSAAECRYSDAEHPERTVRAVWQISRGARPSYRRPSDEEQARLDAALAAVEAETDAGPRVARALFPVLVVGLLLGGCSWLPEGGPVDCIAVAYEAVPVTDSEDQRAAWSAAFAACRWGGS